MRKKEKITIRVSALLLSGVIVSGLIAPAFSFDARAEALPEIYNSSCTLADMCMSYCASSGIAIMNETVINSIYNTVGSSFGTIESFVNDGLLTFSDGTFIDTGLSDQIASVANNIEGFDINTIFNQTAEQSASGVAVSGTASLAGIAGSVASTGVLPLVAGVAVEGFAGFQLGTCIANMLGLYEAPLQNGINVTTIEQFDKIGSANGSSPVYGWYTEGGTKYLFFAENFVFQYSFIKIANRYYLVTYNPNNINTRVRIFASYSNSNGGEPFHFTNQIENGLYSYVDFTKAEGTLYVPFSKTFSDNDSFQEYYQRLLNGQEYLTPPYSPDLIGNNGNLQGDNENGQYTTPDVLPSIDPSVESVNPSALTLEDWLRFANDAKGNYTDGNPDLNDAIYRAIVDALRVVTPTPDPDPDPDPDPTPDPGGETYPVPGPVPDPSPVPDPDYQPETKPQPDFTEKQTENETDITEGDPWTTPDLLDKFPFCIPKDIYRVFTKLDSKARSAPHIQWRFHPNNMIDYTFDIDFSEWDSIATLLRTLELLAFIVGLAIGTRKLIIGG